MALPSRNICIIFNVILHAILRVNIFFYMNTFKMKGEKPTVNYYFPVYKVRETLRSNRLLCN